MNFIHQKCNKYYLDKKISQMTKNLIILHNIQKAFKNNKNQIKNSIRHNSSLMLNGSNNSILLNKKKK